MDNLTTYKLVPLKHCKGVLRVYRKFFTTKKNYYYRHVGIVIHPYEKFHLITHSKYAKEDQHLIAALAYLYYYRLPAPL